MSEAQLGALLTHMGIGTTLHLAATCAVDFRCMEMCVKLLYMAWAPFVAQRRMPDGSAEMHGASLCGMLAVLRQLTVVLQFGAEPPQQREVAVERARIAGFLQVRSSTADLRASVFKVESCA